MVSFDACRTFVGTDDPELPIDGESPRYSVRIGPFRMERAAIDNRRFAHFVEKTNYITEAERLGWSFVFVALLENPDQWMQRLHRLQR